MWSALLSREFPFWPPLMRYRYSWMTTLWKPRQWEGLLSSSRLSRKWRNGRKNLCLCRTSWMNGSRYDSQEENDHTMIIYWAIINHERLIEYVSNVTFFFFYIYLYHFTEKVKYVKVHVCTRWCNKDCLLFVSLLFSNSVKPPGCIWSPSSVLRISWLRCQRRVASLELWTVTGVTSWRKPLKTLIVWWLQISPTCWVVSVTPMSCWRKFRRDSMLTWRKNVSISQGKIKMMI